MFDSGALRLIVLKLIAEQPRHGYNIIRTLKDRFQGAYSPSPGSIYPMLQMLTDVGLVAEREEAGKRLYSVTELGLDHLSEFAAELARIEEQLERAAGSMGEASVGEAIMAFRAALFHRLRQGPLSPGQVEKVKGILNKAREEIEGV